ncbi:porin family protein [Pseudidiomarina sp.]|uniref:porin family protein n=1 Tax=Pseudidiomarina sp. TaxID=2081707 RepID=UPI003A987AD0
MKTLFKVSTIAAVMATAMGTTAAHAQQAPSFDKLGVSYISYDLDGETLNGAGAHLNMSINPDWFFSAEYIYASDDYNAGGFAVDVESASLYGNVGYKFYNMGNTVGYVAGGLVYNDAEVKSSGFGNYSEDDTGWNAQIGLRSRLTNDIEVDANVRHVDIYDDSDQEWTVSGRYFITQEFSLGAGYTLIDSDNSYLALTGSFHF